MQERLRELAEKVFRSYYVPLYPPDKPINEMTSTEQGMYKQTITLTFLIYTQILQLFRDEMPKKKELFICPGKPRNSRHNKEIMGYNQALNDILKGLKG